MTVHRELAGNGDGTQPAALARRLYRALADRDAAALDEILDPGFVGEFAEGMPPDTGGRHQGSDATHVTGRGGIARLVAARAEPEDIVGLDDGRLLVTGHCSGAGRRGDGPVDVDFAHVMSFSEGRVTALRQYTATAGRAPFRTLTLDRADGVATVRLDRPHASNAVNAAMGADLARLAEVLAADPSVRAIALSGNGGTFTVGGDISEFSGIAPADLPTRINAMVIDLHRAIEAITALDAPLVIGVHGACAGAGLSLIGAADVVVASSDSSFSVGYTGIGLTGDGGISWTLPRTIGLRRAQELFLTHRRLPAATALEWGLVTAVVPAEEVDREVARIAGRMAAGPTAAYGAVRRLLRQTFDTGFRDQLAAEQCAIAGAAASADVVEGVTAFVEHRRPLFTGH